MKSHEDLSEFLTRRASEEWEKSQLPYLLSKISPELREDGINYREIIEPFSTLKEFASTLQDKVKIVQHPQHRARIGIIPASETFHFQDTIESPKLEPTKKPDRVNKSRSRHAVISFLETLGELDDEELSKIQIPVSVIVRMLNPK